MKYVTINDLNNTIRRNFSRIPHNIDFVLGVARSGMLPATIISEYLNVPLCDVDSFIGGSNPTGGLRLRLKGESRSTASESGKTRVLVVDDTIFNGNSMRATKKALTNIKDIDFVYMVVYKEGKSEDVDIYLEDISAEADPIVLYEWNIFHHHPSITSTFIYDIDGVLCVNPPDERNEKEYMDYIRNAIPLFIPTSEIGAVCSYRLTKNMGITKDWLDSNGIKCGNIVMFNAHTWEMRDKTQISSEEFKAGYYKQQDWARLFIESDDRQAREIFRLSGKPVYCVESNKMYSK